MGARWHIDASTIDRGSPEGDVWSTVSEGVRKRGVYPIDVNTGSGL
jgi:hypothetical protein